MPTPQAFADMKEKLNKKLAPAEESHHVGSMDPNEVAPTVEALPELVIETETTAYERQERPNSEFLKGQRRVVQAGVEGQVRHFVAVDTQGKRTLHSTEVVKESIPEITEVGTKVLSSNQPAEGVKDLVLANPKLEIEEGTISFEHQERPNAALLKGQRQLVQVGVEGQVRRFVEVDAQGKRTLHSIEVLKEALPEIVEVGTKEEQVSQTRDQALSAAPAKVEETSRELPNTGATRDASLVALGLLGVMSGYGLVALKKRED